MLRQLVRKSTLAPARVVQKRSLHSPFAVLSGSKPRSDTDSKPAETTQFGRTQSFETNEPTVKIESADEVVPRVYVVSQPDPSLGAPFGVRLGAYPVSEPFAQ